MTERPKIIVKTRLTPTDDKRFRELAQANGTTTYRMVRNFTHNYLNQNSQTTA